MLTVDLLSLDEYDRLNPIAENSALESMQSSKYRMVRRWSTPTVAHYAIDKKYEESDQRKWVLKCNHCGYDQVLDFDKNIKLVNPDGIDPVGKVILPGTYEYVCQKCGKLIDRWYTGRWVTTKPGAGRSHGYKISQLDAVWLSASNIKQKELNSPSKASFYNYTIGEPYTDTSNKFLETDVLGNMDMDTKPINRDDYSLVSAGLDYGEHFHHLVIFGLRKESHRIELIDLKRFANATTVEALDQDINGIMYEIRKYNPDIILPDSGYSGSNNLILLKEFGAGKVYQVHVRTAQSNGDTKAHFSDNDNTVTLDKLTQNMIMMSNMRRGGIHFWKDLNQDLRLFIQHWDNVIIRTDEETDNNTQEIKYVKRILRKGDDHYAQASVYSVVGMQELLNRKAELDQNQVLATTIEDSFQSEEQTDIVKELDL